VNDYQLLSFNELERKHEYSAKLTVIPNLILIGDRILIAQKYSKKDCWKRFNFADSTQKQKQSRNIKGRGQMLVGEKIIWNFDNVQKAYATRGYEASRCL
jgi:hypothetical protein